MSAGGKTPTGRAVEPLVSLAHALLREHPDEPELAIAHVGAVRVRVDEIARAARAASPARAKTLTADLRKALAGAGLGALAPAGASIAAMQAALRRLHGIVAALAATRTEKRASSPPPASRHGSPPPSGSRESA